MDVGVCVNVFVPSVWYGFSSQVISIIIIIIGLFTFILSYAGMCPKTYLTIYVMAITQSAFVRWYRHMWTSFNTTVSKLAPSKSFTFFQRAKKWRRETTKNGDDGTSGKKERKSWRVICLMRCYECRWHQHSKFRRFFLSFYSIQQHMHSRSLFLLFRFFPVASKYRACAWCGECTFYTMEMCMANSFCLTYGFYNAFFSSTSCKRYKPSNAFWTRIIDNGWF